MNRFFLAFAFLCASHSLAPVFAQEYKMAGPYEVVARDGEFRKSKGGSERDMKAAWDFAKAGKHEEACKIINAYAEKLQRLDGHDAPLCLIQGYWLCRAMMIERPTPDPSRNGGEKASAETANGNASLPLRGDLEGSWEAMLRRAMVLSDKKALEWLGKHKKLKYKDQEAYDEYIIQ